MEVQVHITGGLPSFTVVGLPDKAVGESRERVRSALTAMGLSLPPKRITVNLSPADVTKEGSHYDLPIAIGVLMQMGVLPPDCLQNDLIMGELALDGRILPVAGVLPAAIAATQHGYGIVCPAANGAEACWASEALSILAAPSLLALLNDLKGVTPLPAPKPMLQRSTHHYPDMADIRGQHSARRALEIAAAGGHNMLMVGPPGSGKSMLAARLPGILPPLTSEEILQVSQVHSIAGLLSAQGLSTTRPFRDPHHNTSMAAMVGGGTKAKPGEITLAHKGVLFLDELAEFPRPVLDALRQPLETRQVTVARVHSHVTFPADIQLIAAMNPCRCGYLGDPTRACTRAPKCAGEYQNKLSGPLLDRIDIHVDVPAVPAPEIHAQQKGEPSEAVAARVQAARQIQAQRYQHAPYAINAHADGDVLQQAAALDDAGRNLLSTAVEKLGLSMRGHTRIVRLARTIADLAGAETVTTTHLSEALSYRERVGR